MADLALLERLYHALPKDDPTLWDLRPYIAMLLRAAVPSESSAKDFTTTYRALSQRETGILQLMADGMSNKQIAQSLGVTPETIKSHAKSIFAKLATRTRAQAVARAEAVGELGRVRAPSRLSSRRAEQLESRLAQEGSCHSSPTGRPGIVWTGVRAR